MSDFVNDRPSRGTFVPQTPQTASSGHIFIIQSPYFFCRRGKNMEQTDEFSDKVIEELVERDKGSTYILLCVGKGAGLVKSLKESAAFKKIDMRFFPVNTGAAGDTITRLRHFLTNMGVSFKPIRNLRTVSTLNIHKFVKYHLVTFVEEDDYAALGISPDKELTFQDRVQQRKRVAWP